MFFPHDSMWLTVNSVNVLPSHVARNCRPVVVVVFVIVVVFAAAAAAALVKPAALFQLPVAPGVNEGGNGIIGGFVRQEFAVVLRFERGRMSLIRTEPGKPNGTPLFLCFFYQLFVKKSFIWTFKSHVSNLILCARYSGHLFVRITLRKPFLWKRS